MSRTCALLQGTDGRKDFPASQRSKVSCKVLVVSTVSEESSTTSSNMWAPEAELLPVSNIDTDGNENGASTFDVSKPPSPLCEAARMAALKKLRHKLTTLSSSATSESGGGNHKPPVLAFERWLARYALRRDEDDGDSDNDDDDEASSSPNDPLIPSDGFVDNALARDLARSAIPFDAAKTIATRG